MMIMFVSAHSKDQTGAGKADLDVGSALIQRATHGQRVSAQGLFPNTCRSKREKLAYAVDVALHCGGALNDVYNCLATLTNPLKIMDCVKIGFTISNKCQGAMNKGCGELEPKCSRCQTNEPMSNQKPGCLLEIYKGCGELEPKCSRCQTNE